jgi:hypothetical protein
LAALVPGPTPFVDQLVQLRRVPRRADVADGHPEEFLAAVTVFRAGRLVHVHEAQRLGVEDPERHGIRLEEDAMALLARVERLLERHAVDLALGQTRPGTGTHGAPYQPPNEGRLQLIGASGHQV